MRPFAVAFAACLACSAVLAGQDIDTVIFDTDRSQFRLIDQVESAAEREALEALLGARDPAGRLKSAEGFLARVPASAFLSVV